MHQISTPSLSFLLALRRLRRGLGWALSVVLALQILAAALAPAGAMARTLDAGLRGDQVVVCTAAGMVVLDGATGDRRAPDQDGFCGLCLPLQHAWAQIVPGMAAPLVFGPPLAAYIPAAEAGRVVLLPRGGPRPQAPPALDRAL